jgi:hypothetical protein
MVVDRNARPGQAVLRALISSPTRGRGPADARRAFGAAIRSHRRPRGAWCPGSPDQLVVTKHQEDAGQSAVYREPSRLELGVSR